MKIEQFALSRAQVIEACVKYAKDLACKQGKQSKLSFTGRWDINYINDEGEITFVRSYDTKHDTAQTLHVGKGGM